MNIYIKAILRSFKKKPLFLLITFAGFSLGITSSLLIYLWIFNELSYDKFHFDYDRIYRVLTLSRQGDEVVKSADCYRPIVSTLKKDYPQIENATYLSYSSEDSPLQRNEGSEKIESRPLWVSNDFFFVFNGFTFIEGNAFDAIQYPSGIVLSETVAQKIFGNEPAVGKTVINDKYSKKVYTVKGVVRIPKQSHIDFGYILTEANPEVADYTNNWGDKGYVRVYVKLRENSQIDKAFLSKITNHINQYSNKADKLLFQPLADIHLHSDYETSSIDKNIGSFKYVLIFSGLAVLIILMASFNFSVLSVARVSERSTEIGIKKINGARRFHIISQFMGESVIQTFIATIFALTLLWFSLPWFDQLSGKELHLELSVKLVLYLLLIILSTGFISGIYPSFFLSSIKPIGILRGGNATGSRSNFIHLLVSVQFCIAIFFIVSTSVFIKQLNYIRAKDLGFNHNNVVVIPTGLWYDNGNFKEELMKNPNILSVSASTYAPVNFEFKTQLPLNHQGITDSLNVSLLWVDQDFAATYQLQVVKGHFLHMNNNDYWKEWDKAKSAKQEDKEYSVSIPVVINEAAEKLLGFDDPIGQRIDDQKIIVGVVKDFNFRPLHYPIGPVIMLNNPENIMTTSVKIGPKNRTETLKFIRDTYLKSRNQRGFSYSFFDDLLNQEYKEELHLKNITTAFSILAILISALGILGMSVFSIDKKIKEIGIRKVNGAKISEILSMLNKDFIRWVAISFLIATPVAYYAMHKWLESFAYKTSLSWWIFALAGLLALVITLFTVSWQSWRAATRNPVEALRYE